MGYFRRTKKLFIGIGHRGESNPVPKKIKIKVGSARNRTWYFPEESPAHINQVHVGAGSNPGLRKVIFWRGLRMNIYA